MGLADDLREEVQGIYDTKWANRDGYVIPEPEDVGLGNDAVTLTCSILYADLAESTQLVDGYKRWFAAEIYKSYLHCASKVIRSEGGEVTAFDGDRVMGVFIGDGHPSCAVRAALKLNFVVQNILNPGIAAKYSKEPYKVRQAVGVDTSDVFVARTGIRGSNDLVWVGPAANYAAKMCSLRQGAFATWISASTFEKLTEPLKATKGKPMWEARAWTTTGRTVYCSSWTWRVD